MFLGYLGHQKQSRKNYISQVRVHLENHVWHPDYDTRWLFQLSQSSRSKITKDLTAHVTFLSARFSGQELESVLLATDGVIKPLIDGYTLVQHIRDIAIVVSIDTQRHISDHNIIGNISIFRQSSSQ